MKENEIRVINNIKLGNFSNAIKLLNQYEKQDYNKTYALHACEYMQKGNYQNAWLWTWRGLDQFSKEPILAGLMELICHQDSPYAALGQ